MKRQWRFGLGLFIALVLSVQQVRVLGGTDFAVVGLVHVFTLGMLVSALGGTSGAHFNPAVTVTLAGLRKIRLADAAIYIVLQLAGAVAAALVVKLLLNIGTPLSGRLLTYDALEMTFRQFKVRRQPECAACGPNAKIDLASIPEFVCAVQTTSNRG